MATKRKIKLNQNAKIFIAVAVVLVILAVFLVGMKPAEVEIQNPEGITEIPTVPAAPPPTTPAVTPPVTAPAVVPNETSTAAFTVPTGTAPPSLKITSLINTPTFPKVGETDLIRIYIKNVGSDSSATTAALTINNQTVTTLNVPALQRNAGAVLNYTYSVTATGDYMVEVNVEPVPGERIFDDNYAKITFTVY